MPLPVIDGVYRISVNFGGIPHPPVTVFHLQATGFTATELEVGDAISTAYGTLANSPWIAATGLLEAATVDILKLDGTSAGHTVALTNHIFGGPGSGDYSPASAAIVKFQTEQRGPRGRGRVFVGPVQEALMNNGMLDTGTAGAAGGAWDDFRVALAEGDPGLVLVVASYKHADAHEVTTIVGEVPLGTQRRRQEVLR